MKYNVAEFEKQIAEYFGAPYAVATDCCTHAIELVLRYKNIKHISVPKNSYLSIPMTAIKIGIDYNWRTEHWQNEYEVSPGIWDSAVLWKENSYRSGEFQCLSFQFKKHLNLNRGGMILCNCIDDYNTLSAMAIDGRLPDIPWKEQNISILGYRYYMTPETAQLGIARLPNAKATKPKLGSWLDYPDISKLDVFKK